jgi:hypothetical protein
MHRPSTRTLCALAFDRSEDYVPAQPLPTALLADLELVTHAAPSSKTSVGSNGAASAPAYVAAPSQTCPSGSPSTT